MITPVRRSLRLFNEQDYVASKSDLKEENVEEKGDDKKLKILLAEHDFAYVPNKALPLDPTPGRRKSYKP